MLRLRKIELSSQGYEPCLANTNHACQHQNHLTCVDASYWLLGTRRLLGSYYNRIRGNIDYTLVQGCLPTMATSHYGYFPLWLLPIMATSRYGYFPLWLLPVMATSRYGYFPLWLLPVMATSHYGYFALWLRLVMATSRYGYLPLWLLPVTWPLPIMSTSQYGCFPLWPLAIPVLQAKNYIIGSC